MNHVLICREYPPAPGGGIGAYTAHLAWLLATRGETVHVIAQQWHGAARPVERRLGGRLVIHRLPYDNWAAPWGAVPHPALRLGPEHGLFRAGYPPLAFAWRAADYLERLVEATAIDLIEAPEYEAPLCVYLLRRAHGLGPRAQPPCLVHLHSPTEFIARANGWLLSAPDLYTAVRLEAFVMDAADGLLCPSHALATEAAAHYHVPEEAITVLPLPLRPDAGELRRGRSAWAAGPICFIGRLEPRKGVFEYLEASVAVARERPGLVFEFAGANVLGSDPITSMALLRQHVPRSLHRQFRFLGQLPRSSLSKVLGRARLAVVPSRWENFPYAAAEALHSGLPVLATRQGALPEMIADGCTGWLVDVCSPAALTAGLRRALATPPSDLEAMGAAAARSIRRLCDPERLAQEHLARRAALAREGPTRSLRPGSSGEDALLSLPLPIAEVLASAGLPVGRPATMEGALPARWPDAGVEHRPGRRDTWSHAVRVEGKAEEPALALQPGPRNWPARLALFGRAARQPSLFLGLLGWAARRLLRTVACAPSLWLSAFAPDHQPRPPHA